MKVLAKTGLGLAVLILAAPVLLYGALIVGECFPQAPGTMDLTAAKPSSK